MRWLPPRRPARRLVLVPARRAGLERHRRRDRGAARGGVGAARAIARGLAYLRRLQQPDGGFALVAGPRLRRAVDRVGDPGVPRRRQAPGQAAFRYLARLRRPDGSYRYSTRYAVTPVWVTSQVLPALARKPFPLR